MADIPAFVLTPCNRCLLLSEQPGDFDKIDDVTENSKK